MSDKTVAQEDPAGPLVGNELVRIVQGGNSVRTTLSAIVGLFSGLTNPMTTLGDIIVGAVSGAAARLGIGAEGTVLTVHSGVPAWQTPAGTLPPAFNHVTATAHTLALTDAPASTGNQGIVVMDNAAANTLTVPPNSAVAFPIPTVIQVPQRGAGVTTIVAGSGVTINSPATLIARVQGSTLLLTKIGTNEWMLAGDMQ